MCRSLHAAWWPVLLATGLASTGVAAERPVPTRPPVQTHTTIAPGDLERALLHARAAHDPHALVAALRELALAVTLAHPERGATLFEEGARLQRETDGPDSFGVRITETQLAIARALAGDRAGQIDPMAAAARAAAHAAASPVDRAQAAAALLSAAQFADSAGRRDVADDVAAQGLALLGRPDTLQGEDAAESYDMAADLGLRGARYADALLAARRAAALWDATGHADGNASRSYGYGADALASLGRFAEAETMLRRSLAVADGAAAAELFLKLLALEKLARFYREMGRSGLALPLFQQALALARGMPKGFRYAIDLEVDLAATYLDRGEPLLARASARLAVEDATRLLGRGSTERGTLLLKLAEIDLALGDSASAITALAEAQTVYAAALTPHDPRRGDPLLLAGRLADARGDSARAASLYRQAMAAMSTRPEGAPERIEAGRRAALALTAKSGQDEAGLELARSAADALARRISDRIDLPSGPVMLDEQERATFDTAVIVAWRAAHPTAPR